MSWCCSVELRCVGSWLLFESTTWCCVDFGGGFSVNLSLMSSKRVDMSKFFQTDATFVRFLPGVNSHMDSQGTKLGKGTVAKGALVRFLASMNSLMNLKMTEVAESSVAVSALVKVFFFTFASFGIFKIFSFHFHCFFI